jgi:putative RecB family exonuclease
MHHGLETRDGRVPHSPPFIVHGPDVSDPRSILAPMAFDLPRTLTPSKVTAFTNCPLAFQYSVIERRPEPPSPHAVKGTLVHSALEGLFWHHPAPARTPAAAGAELARAWKALASDPEFVALALNDENAAAFFADAQQLIDNYFRIEDPTAVQTIGVELGVELEQDGMRLRGIIDRLDIGPDGALTVVDYKTGRAPSERFEHGKMGGVQTYALLCERILGRAPAEVRLLHLRDPLAITAIPTPQTLRGQERRTSAVWGAIERACLNEDFRPKVGPLCQFCHFKPTCPAFHAA